MFLHVNDFMAVSTFPLVHGAENMEQRPLVSDFMKGIRIRCNTGSEKTNRWGQVV
ncbi:unnamed protein product [Boreogadus saida]